MGLAFSSRVLAIAGESFRGELQGAERERRSASPSLFRFLRFLPELVNPTHAAEGRDHPKTGAG